MASIHAFPASVAKWNEQQADELDGVVGDALAAISRIRRAALSASEAERDDLARAAALIDDELAGAVRAIHTVPGDD